MLQRTWQEIEFRATNGAYNRGVLNETEKNLTIYISLCNNFHLPVSSFAPVINF